MLRWWRPVWQGLPGFPGGADVACVAWSCSRARPGVDCCIGTTTQDRVLSCAYAQDRTRLQVADDGHAGVDGVPLQLLHVQTKVDITNHELCSPTFFSFSRSHTCRWQMTVAPAGMACPSSSSSADMSLAGSVSTETLFMLTSSFVGFLPVRTHLQVADDSRAGRDGMALQLVVRRQVAHHHRHHRILPQRLLQMRSGSFVSLHFNPLQSAALVNRPAGCQQMRQSRRQQLREGR